MVSDVAEHLSEGRLAALLDNHPLFLCTFAFGNVDDRKPALFPFAFGHGLDPHKERLFRLIRERHFAYLFVPARKYPAEKGSEYGARLITDEKTETPADQPGALDPQESGAAQVRRTDIPIAVKGKITDRREIVKVGILFQCRLGIIPGLAELGVLHLQLDPLDLQFMKQPPRLRLCPGKVRFRRVRAQKLFRAAAQLGGFS
jgi:hypothetical protein